MTEYRPQRPRLFAFVKRMLAALVVLVVVGGLVVVLVPVQEHVSAYGVVRPRQEVRLHSLVDTVVLEVKAQDGDQVEAGQVLVVLDDAAVREQLAAQEDALALKRADLEVARRSLERLRVAPLPEAYRFTELELARARARLASAQERLARQQSLYEKNLASDQDLTDAKAQVALASIEVKMAERRDQLVRNGLARTILAEAEASVARVQAEVEALQKQVERIRRRLQRYRLTAPLAGRVVRVEKRPGELVSRGELVLVLTPDERRRIFFRVAERDIVKVAKGQKVRIYSPLFPYRQYGIAEGEVYMVENWAETPASGALGFGGRTYEVRAYVTDAPYVLPLGSSVEGEILVGKKRIYRILLGLD